MRRGRALGAFARVSIAAVTLTLACASPRAARADDVQPKRPSPYHFAWTLDAPIVLLGGAASLARFAPATIPACFPRCEPPSNLNGLDARVLGNYSKTALSAADALVISLLVVPHAVSLVAGGGPDAAWLEDVTVSLEAVLLAQGLTQVTKAATARQAPLFYDESVSIEERTSTDALRSFWSGHTATTFAAATSFAVSYWVRHPRDPWRWVVLAALESAALCTGLLKIRAGYHYPTDIAAGAAAGIGVGVLVPALHMTF